MTDMVGQTVGGKFSTVVIRVVSDADVEVGELLVCDGGGRTTILQVYDIENGSQLSDRTKEMLSGTMLGDGPGGVQAYEPEMPNYVLAIAKQLVTRRDAGHGKPKRIVKSFTDVRGIVPDDLAFMDGAGRGRIRLGQVRSGSIIMPGDGFWLDAAKMVSHHVLVVASTGRGKSNFVKCMLWGILDAGGVGMLVLDAHGEYYGGLSRHPNARESLRCYAATREPKRGAVSLSVSVRSVRPNHITGVEELSDAQKRLMYKLHREHGDRWVERLLEETGGDEDKESITHSVLRNKVEYALGLGSRGAVFSTDDTGQNTVRDIVERLDGGQVVVVDTMGMSENEEQALGNMLTDAVMYGRKRANQEYRLDGLPPVGIVAEEAPRLLENAMTGNAYSKIAREGRKFKVGLVAVTQLASVIPDSVLVNLSTKVIFGNEIHKERKAITESAAQDLSRDADNIASLDPGEAIVTSVFAPFAVPIKAPLFDDVMKAGAKPPQKIKVF